MPTAIGIRLVACVTWHDRREVDPLLLVQLCQYFGVLGDAVDRLDGELQMSQRGPREAYLTFQKPISITRMSYHRQSALVGIPLNIKDRRRCLAPM